MSRPAALVALACAAALAGCPIPQPLPDYPAGTITPPRILIESVTPSDPVILVGTDCAAGNEPRFTLSANLYDTNNIEQVVARYFVNYSTAALLTQNPIGGDRIVEASTDPLILDRQVPSWTFPVYGYPPPSGTGTYPGPTYNEAGTVRVVDLLVSNNFYDPPDAAVPPYRGAAANFEVQLYRWVFVLVTGTANCGDHTTP